MTPNSAHPARGSFERRLLDPPISAVAALPSAKDGAGLYDPVDGVVDVLVVPIAAAGELLSARGSSEAADDRATPQPRPTAVQAAIEYDVDVAKLAELHGVSGKAGQLLSVPAPRQPKNLPAKLIFLGVGDERAGSLRRAGAALARATFGAGTVRTSVVDLLPPQVQRAFLEGFLLGGYRMPRAGISTPPKPMAARLQVSGVAAEVLEQSVIAAEATWLARDLTNMPSNLKTPQWMAEQSRRVAQSNGLSVSVREEEQLESEGFGGILAVGAGSASGPRLVEISYTPAEAAEGRGTKHIVLAGKGITFDSGGLSLKPRESMVPMKTDMAGAAVVLATVSAAAKLGVRHRVTALLALAENAIGGGAYRPSDVVTAYGGTTIEVGNTDAEGRMVLADTLAYAVETLQPDVLIDVATLTGAASIGLGQRHGALYSNTEELVGAFKAAADAAGERIWHMPMVEDYAFALDSPIADLAHIAAPSAKIGGGSIFAALFLRSFVADTPWVHLDIAGPARAAADEHEVAKGATGYGTRLLLRYLQDAGGAVERN